MEKITESCKYTFTDGELVEIAKTQARFHSEMTAATEQFDNIKADHKSTVTRLESDISMCTRRVTSGYEMRMVACLVLKFRPDNETALLVRLDSGLVIRKRKLTDDEKQLKLTTKEPEPYTFEADLYEDVGGETTRLVADHVALTSDEAKELSAAIKVRPMRPLLGDGKKPKK